MRPKFPNNLLSTLIAFALGVVTSQAQTKIGVGADHDANDVDSAGTRMNIEKSDDTFPTLEAGSYDVTDFEYLNSDEIADIQPFLAISTDDTEYVVIWVGPTEESPGDDDIVTTSYEAGSQQFTLDDDAEVFAGFNAGGPAVRFGGGLTDHANPADFEIEVDSEVFGFGHANLGRSYAFNINVVSAGPVTDTDEDGMPDEYEEENGLDPNVNDAALDKDGDGLTNFTEFELRTNPQSKDTDGDGVDDNVETNTGTWVDANNRGTDPRDSDSDGDNLSDGVETNTGTFVDATNTGTDPHKKDTDGDGASDGLEVTIGTSPLDASQVPSNIAGGGPWEVTHVWTEGDPQIGDATTAEDVIDDPGDAESIMVETDYIHFHDNVDPPRFLDLSRAYPIFDEENGGDGPGTNDDFAIRAVGQINVVTGGLMTFNCNSDDGFVLTIDGEIIGEAGNRGRADTIMTAELTAGVHDVEFIHWERGGGAGVSLEVYRGVGDDAPAPNEDDWELLTPIPKVDTDGDGIPDSVEDQHEFLDPNNAADGALDQDEDTLSNAYEYVGLPAIEGRGWVRTDFTKKDSDEDGLDDNVESNTGTYVDATNTGTHPTRADSDGDGLSDGVETNTGTFVSATNPGTSPVNVDTDGDGFDDDVELAEGSDPTSAASQPVITEVVIGVGADHEGSGVDSAGSRMNIENTEDTFPTLPAGTYDVTDFEYSNSADSADVQPFLVVSTDEDIYSVIWIGPTEEAPGDDDIVTISYELGTQQFTLDEPADVYAGFNADGPVVKFGAGLTDHANPANFDIEIDGEIADFGHANLPRSYAFNINVEQAGGTGFQITEITYAGGETPTVTLTFDSRPGANYAVYASTAMAPDGQPGSWLELTDNLESEGEETTYVDTAGVEFGPEVYYQIRTAP